MYLATFGYCIQRYYFAASSTRWKTHESQEHDQSSGVPLCLGALRFCGVHAVEQRQHVIHVRNLKQHPDPLRDLNEGELMMIPLAGGKRAGRIQCENRTHFFALCAQMIRRILWTMRAEGGVQSVEEMRYTSPLDEVLQDRSFLARLPRKGPTGAFQNETSSDRCGGK